MDTRLVFVSVVSIFLAFPALSQAQSVTCGNSLPIANWQGTTNKVYYYIHQDFDERLRDCTPSSVDDSDMISVNTTQVVGDAAERWNVELDTAALIFGGYFSDSTPCTYFSEPAIKIEFIAGCTDADGLPNCDPNQGRGRFSFDIGFGGSGSLACNNSKITRIQIYGRLGVSVDQNGNQLDQDCRDSNNFVRNDNYKWNLSDTGINDTNNNPNLVATLTHEIGHALGISHPPLLPGYTNPGGCPYVNVDNANKALVSCGAATYQRHLNGYDQTCGYNNTTGVRNVQYYWQGFDPGGSTVSNVQTSVVVDTNKGLRSGGYLVDGSFERFALYSYDELNHSFAGIDGYFSFTSTSPYSLSSTVHSLPVSPNIFTFRESLQSDYINRLGYVEDYYSDDVPRHKYIRNILGSNQYVGSFSACSNSSCSSTTAVKSHLPMSTAWDEYSQRTVYVWVQTNSTSGQGLINLSAGLRSYAYLLNQYTTNPINGWAGVTYPSSGYTGWEYSGKTDFPVGVACEPDRDQRDYNCILAWQDRGVPNGSVLYRYFRVNSSTYDIEFRPGGPIKRSGSNTSNGVSAAFFGNKFWLTWKASSGLGVKYTQTNCATGYTCWTNLFSATSSGEVVDPPTWFYIPHQSNESGLVWTISN